VPQGAAAEHDTAAEQHGHRAAVDHAAARFDGTGTRSDCAAAERCANAATQ
jgi:hypothetical protein